MLKDCRSKKVVFMAHCLLNQNAVSDGMAVFAAGAGDLHRILYKNDIGIVQMPCPELMCLGLDRGNPAGGEGDVLAENTRIRGCFSGQTARERLEGLVEESAYQIEQYLRHGFRVVGVIGVNPSPSCGVETTTKADRETPGMGVMMELLQARAVRVGWDIPIVGVKPGERRAAVAAVRALLGGGGAQAL